MQQQFKVPAEFPAFASMLARGELFIIRVRRTPTLTNTLTVPRDGKPTLTLRVDQWYGPISPAGALELLTVPALSGFGRSFEVLPLSIAAYMHERETGRPIDIDAFKSMITPLGRAGFDDSEVDPVFKNAGLWGFWREDWRAVSYGYECESSARLAAKGYAETDATPSHRPDSTGEAASFWRLFGRPFSAVNDGPLPTMPTQPQDSPHVLVSLVQRFARAMFDKLNKASNKHGFRLNPWMRNDWADELRSKLRECVTKGDPLDVAAYCAFAWHHGWPTATDADRKEVEQTHKLLEDLKAVFLKHSPTSKLPSPTSSDDAWEGLEAAALDDSGS